MPEYKIHKPGSCGGVLKKSLWAEPPPNSSGWYVFRIERPRGIRDYDIDFWIGIRDGVNNSYGTAIRFEIQINDNIVFKEEVRNNFWVRHVIPYESNLEEEIVISFVTTSIGNSQAHGALWGDPIMHGRY
jgi:hypothetical protein